ncbi:hypothetical protein LguiB_024224 [Lonicera macranthoides]
MVITEHKGPFHFVCSSGHPNLANIRKDLKKYDHIPVFEIFDCDIHRSVMRLFVLELKQLFASALI